LDLARLRWLSIVVPVALLVAFAILLRSPFHDFLHDFPGVLVLVCILAVGVTVFSFAIFGAIGRVEERILQRNRELAAVLTPPKIQKAMQFMSNLPRRDPVLAEEALAKLPEEERALVAPTVRTLISGLPRDRLTKDLVAAVAYLGAQPFVRGDRIGAVGFCFGGNMSIRLACETDLAACVVFYGENPSPIERVKDIRGPVLGLYGAEDARINADLDELVKAMAEHRKDFEMRIYPGAGHAFFNDTNPSAYREAAARDAWDRVLRFYRRTLMS